MTHHAFKILMQIERRPNKFKPPQTSTTKFKPPHTEQVAGHISYPIQRNHELQTKPLPDSWHK
jgi:hypothetical protein